MHVVHARSAMRRTALLLTGLMLLSLAASGCGPRDGASSWTVSSKQASPGADGAADRAHGSVAVMEEGANVGYSGAAPADALSPAASRGSRSVSRLIIRNASIRYQVKDVQSSIEKIQAETLRIGGMVTDLQTSTEQGGPIYRETTGENSAPSDGAALSAYFTVRVPNDKFNTFIERIKGVGKVLRQTESQTDVTQEHVDLSARLENLRAEEKRLRTFFDKARNVKEMLEIETELSRVRGEVESLKAQVDYLERQAALATLTIELVEPSPIVQPSGDDWGFADAVRDGLYGAAGVLQGLITVGIAALPILLLALFVFFVIRTSLRRRAGRRATSPDIGTPVDVMDEIEQGENE